VGHCPDVRYQKCSNDHVGESRIIAPERDRGRTYVLVAASKEPVNGRVVVECRVKFFRIEPVGLIVQLELFIAREVPLARIAFDWLISIVKEQGLNRRCDIDGSDLTKEF